MKLVVLKITLLIIFTVLASPVHAALTLLGQGVSSHGTHGLVYDSVLDITWYDYTSSPKEFFDQKSWAQNLTVSFGNIIIDDWRLPDIYTEECHSFDCSDGDGELSHLYEELGNSLGGSLEETGDFQFLKGNTYWTQRHRSSGYFYTTNMANGELGVEFSSHFVNDWNAFYGIAVRSGEVSAVPLPPAVWLLGSGIIGLIGFRRKKKI